METILNLKEKKKAVLKKFYGGVRESYMHKIRLSDGRCEYCDVFLGVAIKQKYPTLCSVITPDEVNEFRESSFYD